MDYIWKYFSFFFVCYSFWDEALLCYTSWLWTQNPLSHSSLILPLQMCASLLFWNYMVLEIKLRFTGLCSFSLLTEVSFQGLERKFLNTSVWNKINVDIFQVIKQFFFTFVGGDFIFIFCWPVCWEGGWVYWEHLGLLLQLTLMIVFLSD